VFDTLPHLIDDLRDAPAGHHLAWTDGRGRAREMPWRAYADEVLARAGAYAARGVRAGDRVLVCLDHDPATLGSFLALLYLGAVPLSVAPSPFGREPRAQLDLVERLRAGGGARWVLDQPALLAADEAAARVAAADRLPIEADPSGAAPAPARPRRDDVAFVQFSSGSTSQPKGIRVTHRGLAENVRLVVAAGARRPDEALVTWLPMSHDMGLVGTWFASLALRIRHLELVAPLRFLLRPTSWLLALSAARARVATCPAFALDHCVERLDAAALDAAGADLSALEAVVVGAETVLPASAERFEQALRPWGLRPNAVAPVYGLAEATLIVTAHPLGAPRVTRRVAGVDVLSVGPPLGDFEARVAGAGDAGEPGEILLRGTCVTPGLLDPAGDADLFEDGWLRTGDLGVMDEDGRLFVTGRIKDLLIVDGRNFHARDLCAAVDDLPFLRRGRSHAFSLRIAGRGEGARQAARAGALRPGAGRRPVRAPAPAHELGQGAAPHLRGALPRARRVVAPAAGGYASPAGAGWSPSVQGRRRQSSSAISGTRASEIHWLEAKGPNWPRGSPRKNSMTKRSAP
jgi:fatty-acyl-CoA synthase